MYVYYKYVTLDMCVPIVQNCKAMYVVSMCANGERRVTVIKMKSSHSDIYIYVIKAELITLKS